MPSEPVNTPPAVEVADKKKKKDKKDKKDKKEKSTDVEMTDAPADADTEEKLSKAERKAAKEQRKKEKAERKAAKAEKKAKAAAESPDAAAESKEEKKRKRSSDDSTEDKADKKQKNSTAAVATAGTTGYKQSDALTAIPQADIDAFLAKNFVTIEDSESTTTLRPVLAFSHLPTSALLAKNPFAKFSAPTPIQSASWPYTLSGRDVIGVAETGSGKTMAFALPCVEKLSSIKKKGIKAVVVSPTRELAIQTAEQVAQLAGMIGLKCVCVYGGASKDDQRTELRRGAGADIIVATPGRLKDFMSDGTVDLGAAQFVVLDEADRMLDKGFEEDIKEILRACPAREKRTTLMFTATWPVSVQQLAATMMVTPVKINISNNGKQRADGELQANTRITQTVEVVDPKVKEQRLLQILKTYQNKHSASDRILVFCLYKKEATRVETFLAQRGVKVCGIHGDLRQEQRSRSLEAFKSGATPVLVATDVAARGLDIPEVKLVINVTFPLTIEDYVHRIGRTGRAGKTGEAYTLFTLHDKAHSGSLINILKSANQNVPEDLLKFGTTVKKKVHPVYGAFFREVDTTKVPAKIVFDD
ncbi:hypothetical protein TD95_005004 [Thielaviopsis punctulata]|uniref:RNA helicase n=1 Tax=Thielaviopsis punctulata TaxID=72032 RepID=A0A0F4ZBT8_9PEZI|nr:hypothetical protein TD95_005004 [Thielaviopsis punctulata]